MAREFTENNYINVPGFAIVRLKLSGNELLCYSLIYGITQDGESEFYGSLHYVSTALNVTRQNAKRIIDRLVDKGLLRKKELEFSGVKFCHYIAIVPSEYSGNGVAETITGDIKTATGGVVKTATHNITNNIHNKQNNKESALFEDERPTKKTSENLCLFADSKFAAFNDFQRYFPEDEYRGVDIQYYWQAVARWSASGGKKKRDWIATAKNFIEGDKSAGKLHTIAPAMSAEDRAITERLMRKLIES